jgi:prefoldin subunit 5
VSNPAARGKLLLQQANVALRIREISSAVHEDTLISLSSHLSQLAEIRDLAKLTGQIKVAFSAERSRGEAIGIYQRHDQKNKGGPTVAVQVNFASPHDANI